jgi:anti-sigma regulatory factor (Ser/Thr protein kinase)
MIGSMVEHTLTVAADVDNLAQLRRFVREATAALGADPEAVYCLELAVEEAACNAVTHGYQGLSGSIEVGVKRDGDAVLIRVRDWAPPFDPSGVPDPDLTLPLEQRPLGGLGIYLIRRSVDEVTYRLMPDGGNELTLTKRLKSKEGDDGHCHA